MQRTRNSTDMPKPVLAKAGTSQVGEPLEHISRLGQPSIAACHFFDGNRAIARRAISEGACSGNGNTELTLISQST
jgi:hypothetical protein